MERKSRMLGAILFLTVPLAVGCGSSNKGGGAVGVVCGKPLEVADFEMTGPAPEYVNASTHVPEMPIAAPALSHPVYLRISSDCSVGAPYYVTGHALWVTMYLLARDAQPEVLLISPRASGDGVIHFTPPKMTPQTVTIKVTPPPQP